MIGAFTVCFAADAQSVPMQEALTIAQDFMPYKTFSARGCCGVRSVSASSNAMSYYVFNAEGKDGFVIVSGDERTEPILGYSCTGTFDVESMPENVAWWMRSYDIAIENVQQLSQREIRRMPTGEYEYIDPLLKTQWDQFSPYYQQCPVIDGDTCVTGCVATAVAQIMKYYNHPKTSKGTFRYRTKTNRILMQALPEVDFDWTNMLDTYSSVGWETKAQKDAVATLMLYCGCAMNMDYGVDGSGADATPVCDAMEYFFGYDEDIHKVYRDDYDTEAWEQLIYDELAKGFPVFYSGRNEASGHAFVCDGYLGGFFHINWGWGGVFDGYFKLSILYPYTYSFDETEYADGYASGQMAVVNIVPKDFQGFETGVNDVVVPKPHSSYVYNLLGQRKKYVSRGVNIIDGKKVVVK